MIDGPKALRIVATGHGPELGPGLGSTRQQASDLRK